MNEDVKQRLQKRLHVKSNFYLIKNGIATKANFDEISQISFTSIDPKLENFLKKLQFSYIPHVYSVCLSSTRHKSFFHLFP
jgi:hypothetical protein